MNYRITQTFGNLPLVVARGFPRAKDIPVTEGVPLARVPTQRHRKLKLTSGKRNKEMFVRLYVLCLDHEKIFSLLCLECYGTIDPLKGPVVHQIPTQRIMALASKQALNFCLEGAAIALSVELL